MTSLSPRYRFLLLLFVVQGFFTTGNAVYVIRILWSGSQASNANFQSEIATRVRSNPYFRWQVLSIDGQPFTRGDQIREAIEARRPQGESISVTLESSEGETRYNDPGVAVRPHRRTLETS